MIAVQPSPAEAAHPLERSNPFRGLAQYRRNDHLFARDKDAELIQSRLWSSRVTVMFAGSGVGKSSFLNAKLIPTLEEVFRPENVAVPDANSWARVDPKQALAQAKAQVTAGKPTRRGGIIILDQFEEVFQHFPTPILLREFGQELANITDEDSGLNVRLLISIREEFLAELTSLDDFLPGVLANYYRLRRLTTKQAKFIIDNTAALAGIGTSPNVDALIRDLCSLDRRQRRHNGIFVDPPYLQIVCQRVWNREQPTAGAPFLSSYKEGGAEQELEAYCREKLARLARGQKVLVRKALEHLTGPHEAKKSGRVIDLARESRVRNPSRLADALDALAGPEIRILRGWEESPASDWSQQNPGKPRRVYQLYHDMYAPMLWRWKEEQERKDRRRSVALWVAATAALAFFVLWPVTQRMVVTRAVNLPTYGNGDEFSAVLDMRNAFARTMIFRELGDRIWRGYTDKLATLSALKLDMDGAIAYRLAGLATSGRSTAANDVKDALGPGRNLIGTLPGLKGITDAVIVKEAGATKVIMGTSYGGIVEWKPNDPKERKTSRLFMAGDDHNVAVPTGQASGNSDAVHASLMVDSDKGLGQAAKTLCLSPDGKRAVTARIEEAAREGESRIVIQSFSTGDGRALDSGRGFPTLSQNVGQAPESGNGQARSIDFDTSAALSDMQGVYDQNGARFAVMTPEGAVIYDGPQQWILPEPKVGRVAFVNDGVILASEHFPMFTRKISFWTLEAGQRGESMTPRRVPIRKEAFLPWTARLVVRKSGDVLAVVDNQWAWISPTSTVPQRLPFAPFARRAQAGGPPPPMFTPQAYDAKNEVLLFMDNDGRLALSHTGANPERYSALPISEQRGEVALTRQVTDRSVGTLSDGLVVSIDDLGTVARLWQIPSPSDPVVKIAAADSIDPMARDICAQDRPRGIDVYCSVDNKWQASVQHGHASSRASDGPYDIKVAPTGAGASASPWTVKVDGSPRGVMVSASGSRILVLYDDGFSYWERGSASASKRISENVKKAAFGPGPHRITLLTDDDVVIYEAASMASESESAEWRAPCAAELYWFVPKADENSVLLHSRFWMHRFQQSGFLPKMMARLTRGGHVWPRVTSVLTGAPIDHNQFQDSGQGDRRLVQGDNTPDASERHFMQVNGFEGGSSIRQWLNSLVVRSCRQSLADAERSWRGQLCHWEQISGRRAGIGLTH